MVNRLLIEFELEKLLPGWLTRPTPIITCLVENTGHHRALEKYKKTFQEKQRAVVDFDAQPLAELYATSQTELFRPGAGNYDLIFHYHLAVSQYFRSDVVAPLGASEIRRIAPQLIPAVERECCYVAHDRDGAKRVPVTVPINANSMLLIVNDELFRLKQDEYRKEKPGAELTAPVTWGAIRSHLGFLCAKA